jgi:hypothetical protein
VKRESDPSELDWRRVFVGNIGWWVDEEMLRYWFSQYGAILDVQVRLDGKWGVEKKSTPLCDHVHVTILHCVSAYSIPRTTHASTGNHPSVPIHRNPSIGTQL